MTEPITTQVDELVRFLERYRRLQLHPILWIGAGASAAAGYPTLGQIEVLLRNELPGVALTGFALIDAYVREYSKADLTLLLQHHLGQPRPFVALHEALVRLAVAGVCPVLFTTNYDRLLENALSTAGVEFAVQTLQANLTLQAVQTVQLLKLHGDLGDWASVVLTAVSYAEFERTYPVLQSQLSLNLRTRPLLFVGCSMRDPRLLDWLEGLSPQERGGLYASRVLITTADWQALPSATRALLDSANIKAIPVPDHASVERVLVQVAARCAPATPTELVFDLTPEATDWTILGPTPDSPPHRVPNPLNDREFLARLQELRQWSSRPLRLDDPQTPARRAALEQLARHLGSRLTQVLLSTSAQAAVVQRLNQVDHGRAQLTIRVAEPSARGDQALALPWELLMPVAGTFAVQAGQLDVVRDAVTAGAPILSAPQAPLAVAALIAAPEGQAALRYEEEAFRLYAALAPLGHQVAMADLGTVEDLVTVVQGHNAAVIHFSGHGLPGKLAFENDEGFENVVEINDLIRQLRTHVLATGQARAFPRLFYLASCYGASGHPHQDPAPTGWVEHELRSEVEVVLGHGPSTAATLHRSGFTQVVGYYGPVGDTLCTRAEEAFYRSLARGDTTLQAVALARAGLDQPLTVDDVGLVYPLAWVQLTVYHRGPNLPLALPGSWQAPAQGWWETMVALSRQGLMVLASTRYLWPELGPHEWVPIEPLSPADVLRMLAAFDTLEALPYPIKVQLAARVDGHPRTVEFVDALLTRRQQELGLGHTVTDAWRELVQPVLSQVQGKVSADLLLEVLWHGLPEEARAHALNLAVLQSPAPRWVVEQLGQATDVLLRTSLLTRHREQVRVGEALQWQDRWGCHSLVKAFLTARMADAARHAAHATAGTAYAEWLKRPGALWSDLVEGIQHFHTIGAGDSAWPMVREYVLWLRRQGRYREALALLERCETAGTAGGNLSVALNLLVQMRGFLGDRSPAQNAILERALTLAETEAQQGDLLHELGSVLYAQGDLPGARQRLERALAIQARAFGTDNHPSVAASLHALARVLQVQGDLPGARLLLEKALSIKERLYGSRNHFSIAMSETNLGVLLLQQGEDVERAMTLFRHADEVLQAQLGPDHPDTQASAAFLSHLAASSSPDPLREAITQARAAAERGDLTAAIAAQSQAVTLIQENATADRDMLVQLSVLLYNLAGYYHQAQRYQEAVTALEQVVALDERTGHEDLAADRTALEEARRLAAPQAEK